MVQLFVAGFRWPADCDGDVARSLRLRRVVSPDHGLRPAILISPTIVRT